MCIRFLKKGGIDTTDATAAPGDLAKNKTAYVNNTKITGKLENKNNTSLSGTVTTSSNAVTFGVNNISPGYYYPSGGNIKVKANNDTIASAVGLTANKIKKDETILGVTGTYEGSGGSSFPPDWSLIGYQTTPSPIIDDFNYSKNIYDNWDSTETTLANKFKDDKKIIYMPLVDISNATNINHMFDGCSNLKYIPQLDTSNVENIGSMFYNCTSLETISLLNTSSATTVANMFFGCSNLKYIPQLDTSNARDMYTMFSGCSSLETIPLLNTSSVTNFTNMFTNCSSLSNESLNTIMQMCINATTYAGTKTLKKLGITSAQATICQGLSNYQAFLNAGWTTGY